MAPKLPKQITDKYDIVKNTFIGKDKGEVNAEREIEIGDIHSDDFQPQFKMMNWENQRLLNLPYLSFPAINLMNLLKFLIEQKI